MKKLTLTSSLFLLFSCGNNDTVTIDKQEYNRLKGVKSSEYPKDFKIITSMNCFTSGVVLGSDGHEYLITDKCSNGQNVDHYVDCKLCAKRNKNEIR